MYISFNGVQFCDSIHIQKIILVTKSKPFYFKSFASSSVLVYLWIVHNYSLFKWNMQLLCDDHYFAHDRTFRKRLASNKSGKIFDLCFCVQIVSFLTELRSHSELFMEQMMQLKLKGHSLQPILGELFEMWWSLTSTNLWRLLVMWYSRRITIYGKNSSWKWVMNNSTAIFKSALLRLRSAHGQILSVIPCLFT